MNRDRYNPETKECKDCGCLLPDRPIDIREHICSPFSIERKLKATFGPREPKETQEFFIGQEVEAKLIGKIDHVMVTRNGDYIYRITDDEKNVHGYFLQSQVMNLLTPKEA